MRGYRTRKVKKSSNLQKWYLIWWNRDFSRLAWRRTNQLRPKNAQNDYGISSRTHVCISARKTEHRDAPCAATAVPIFVSRASSMRHVKQFGKMSSFSDSLSNMRGGQKILNLVSPPWTSRPKRAPRGGPGGPWEPKKSAAELCTSRKHFGQLSEKLTFPVQLTHAS